MPTFSIIVPTFDRPHFLVDALSSLIRQTYGDFECVVVDDNSREPARVPDDTRFKVVRRPVSGGPAAAVNTGLEHVSGEFVIRMDDDDLFTADRLELCQRARGRAPVILCFGRYLDEPASKATGLWLEGDVHDIILDNVTPHMGTAAVARPHFLPLNEDYAACEDVDWWLRMVQVASVTTVEQVGYLIRRHDEIRVRHGTQARIEGSKQLLREHAAYFQAHPRAAALRWKRIGLYEMALGSNAEAARAFRHSMSLKPSVRTFVHMARARLH